MEGGTPRRVLGDGAEIARTATMTEDAPRDPPPERTGTAAALTTAASCARVSASGNRLRLTIVVVGLVLGLLQFVTTFAITMYYARWADRELDPAAEKLAEHMERGTLQ